MGWGGHRAQELWVRSFLLSVGEGGDTAARPPGAGPSQQLLPPLQGHLGSVSISQGLSPGSLFSLGLVSPERGAGGGGAGQRLCRQTPAPAGRTLKSSPQPVSSCVRGDKPTAKVPGLFPPDCPGNGSRQRLAGSRCWSPFLELVRVWRQSGCAPARPSWARRRCSRDEVPCGTGHEDVLAEPTRDQRPVQVQVARGWAPAHAAPALSTDQRLSPESRAPSRTHPEVPLQPSLDSK